MSYELYRNTTVGNTLQDTLDELVQTGRITPQLALKVLRQFDKSVNAALPKRANASITFKANKLSSYNFCDNVWVLRLKDVDFREVPELGTVDKVKIVACEGKNVEEDEKRE